MHKLIQALVKEGCIDPTTTARKLSPVITSGVSVQDAINRHRALRPNAYYRKAST